MKATIAYSTIDSPVGRLVLAADDRGLCAIRFQQGPRSQGPDLDWTEAHGPLERVADQLGAYFAGRLRRFDLPLSPRGTPFQLEVWRRLLDIPYGETISYGELARRIGTPRASRAVGLANGANPIPIVIPCHRVIGGNGTLTGYGGGLPIKAKLLALERGELRLL